MKQPRYVPITLHSQKPAASQLLRPDFPYPGLTQGKEFLFYTAISPPLSAHTDTHSGGVYVLKLSQQGCSIHVNTENFVTFQN